MITYNQLSLADILSDCQEIYDSDKPQFLSLLQQHIDLDEIVPASFRKHFYASTGRTRKYPLNAFLWALLSNAFFPSLPIPCSLFSFTIPGTSGNSVGLTKSQMLPRSHALSRISLKISKPFLNGWSILRNPSVRPSTRLRPL